ncbi:MAG: putative electron transfer oxidoreductase [Rariglobus sp.]|jgi:2-polyprenyl-6-methoxyphenol hydroxylase-like FAD-dependent oxidoreductase|nr:putative electron transfer oxidoreductase [Rariglobus sp.]
MTGSKPVEIVGGGLAGLALGIGLRRAGVPVTVFEAGDYPRHRVCGEFIAGLEEGTLERLGIQNVFEGSLRHEGVQWFSGDQAAGKMRLPSPAVGISRFTLDARLAGLFLAHGGKLVTRHRVTGKPEGEGRVNAAGRRRAAGSPWVGLKAHVRNLSLTSDLELHLGDGAYIGLAPVEEGWINVCGLFRRRAGLGGDTPRGLAETLRGSGLKGLAARVEVAEFRPSSVSAVAGFAFDRRVGRGRGVVLGDTCAMVPPFTGNGMAMAFTGAALALGPLVDWAAHGVAWETVSARIHLALQREFRLRLGSAAWLHPLLLNRHGQGCLRGLTRAGLLPMRPLYHLLH